MSLHLPTFNRTSFKQLKITSYQDSIVIKIKYKLSIYNFLYNYSKGLMKDLKVLRDSYNLKGNKFGRIQIK